MSSPGFIRSCSTPTSMEIFIQGSRQQARLPSRSRQAMILMPMGLLRLFMGLLAFSRPGLARAGVL